MIEISNIEMINAFAITPISDQRNINYKRKTS